MKDNRPYDKLYHFEVPPPTNLWGEISKELDNQKYSQKLSQAEVMPPANIWSKIEKALYPNKTISIFRYAAVAASILGLAFVGNYLYNSYLTQQKQNDALHLAQTANTNNAPVLIYANPQKNEFVKVEQPAPTIEITAQKAKFKARPERVYVAATTLPEKIALTKENALVDVHSFTDAQGNIVFNPNLILDPNSNYLTITGPNGQQTRISSKFLPMITEINASKNQRGFYRNYPIPEAESWRQRFSEWRKKLIQEDSTKIPATNLIELLNTKSENPK